MSKEIFTGGATTSQHVDAEDDDHFNNTTFKLKRTRSLGLLDEFIPEKLDNSEEAGSVVVEGDGDAIQKNVIHETPVLALTPVKDAKQPEEKEESKEEDVPFSPEFIPHDDNDIEEEPSRHVDYFSHKWDVGDISKSWRYIIQKRKNVANSARLENASWRTWAQRRSNLKTINPELLNWSKENDITWLYGPILKDTVEDTPEDDHVHSHHSNIASSAVAGDISIPSDKKKSILKKRSVQDMMISHANLVKLEAIENRLKLKKEQQQQQLASYRDANHRRTPSHEPPEFDDYDAISEKLNSQYRFSSQSLVELNKQAQLPTKEPEIPQPEIEDSVSTISNLSIDKKSRHIHFNTEVQQCIAINPDEDEEYDDEDEDEDDYSQGQKSFIYTEDDLERDHDGDIEDDDEDDEDDEDGGFFLKVKSPNSTTQPPFKSVEPSPPSLSKTEDSDSVSTSNSRPTIYKLPSTSINWGSDEESDDNAYTTVSHNVNNTTSRGYDYYYDYNTVYTGETEGGVDVVDLPEELVSYGNYENLPVIDSNVINSTNHYDNYIDLGKKETNEAPKQTFNLNQSDSESDSDSDEGLSMGTRSSSQSLAQQVFNLPEIESHPQAPAQEPIQDSMYSINPNYQTGMSKQSTSSGSLSEQFFGTTPINRELSSSFFGEEFPSRSSPLPPKTTSKNIFTKSNFSFDSDSDEYVEDVG